MCVCIHYILDALSKAKLQVFVQSCHCLWRSVHQILIPYADVPGVLSYDPLNNPDQDHLTFGSLSSSFISFSILLHWNEEFLRVALHTPGLADIEVIIARGSLTRCTTCTTHHCSVGHGLCNRVSHFVIGLVHEGVCLSGYVTQKFVQSWYNGWMTCGLVTFCMIMSDTFDERQGL